MSFNAKKSFIVFCCMTLISFLFAACGAGQTAGNAAAQTPVSAGTAVSAASAADTTAAETAAAETSAGSVSVADTSTTAAPIAGTSNTDINRNDTGKTLIRAISKSPYYPGNSYMILSKSGTEVVADPMAVIDGLVPDIITSTHAHGDHNDKILDSRSACRKSYYKVEEFAVKDVKVKSIASTHNGDEIKDNDPSNVIYVFDLDGLRIAHMGDIGQEQLTDGQIKELGRIDVAFMQFVNDYSGYSLENEKGFKLIEQLKPQIIIPTHTSKEANEKIGSMVGELETVDNVLTISKDDLKDGKRKVIVINNKNF